MRQALVGYKPEKAAQISALFAELIGGPVDKLKLIKLIYLSEREFLSRHRHPMLFDEMYSLPHGPICSNALNGINGETSKETWLGYIQRKGNKVTSVLGGADREKFDQLSEAEIDVVQQIWESFGFMTPTQIRNWTHKHCPEYTELETGRLPISYKDILDALGEDEAEEIADSIDDIRRVRSMLTA